MKTPEEIKKGLECCGVLDGDCENCPYDDGKQLACADRSRKDAIAYIIHLESRLAQVERERDALMYDLKMSDMIDCVACKHQTSMPQCEFDCVDCKEQCICNNCRNNNHWEWRGICAENTKEA